VINRERRLMGGELKETFLVKNVSSDPFMIEYDDSPSGIIFILFLFLFLKYIKFIFL
jgi:hypothetical protein